MTWLVAGLGNPGPKYARNRHNIGFMVVDELARALPPHASWKSKQGAETTSGMIAGTKAVLVKPMEFMNLSGFAVQRTLAFHSVEIDKLVVVHDELDLDAGIVRLKQGGGHGGHNGLRSIMEQLGTGDFLRVRMGIGRSDVVRDAAAWVLSDFPTTPPMISAGCEGVEAILAKGIKQAMNLHNARPAVL